MFVIDVTFQGGAASVERMFVRRPYLTIGAADSSHLVVGEMANLGFALHVQRDLARSFKVTAVSEPQRSVPPLIGGTYDGRASVDLGVVKFEIIALDFDLLIRDNEPLDKAGVRILRRACSEAVPEFPALCVITPMKAVVSFWPDQPLLVGRSRSASVRLDVPTVSLQHARIGYESGDFWIEDLGSTNGTFVGDRQVSSRVSVPSGTPIIIGKSASVVGITSREQLASLDSSAVSAHWLEPAIQTLFPSLISLAPVARPSRVVLKPGMHLDLGRDPSCGLWLGAPHISRRHCAVEVSKTGEVRITDSSTNGTAYDGGLLRSSDVFKTTAQPVVLDFGAGVTVALCFTENQEEAFKAAYGAPHAFTKHEAKSSSERQDGRTRVARERRNTTWFKIDDSTLNQLRSKNSRMARLRAMFSGLTLQGRVALVFIAAGFAMLLVVMAWMVVS